MCFVDAYGIFDVSQNAERVNNLNRNSVLGVSPLVVIGGGFFMTI
jgi:hypothetical protein